MYSRVVVRRGQSREQALRAGEALPAGAEKSKPHRVIFCQEKSGYSFVDEKGQRWSCVPQ